MGNMNLTGEDATIWEESRLDELVTMERSTLDGITSSRATVTLVELYHKAIGRHLHVSSNDSHTTHLETLD